VTCTFLFDAYIPIGRIYSKETSTFLLDTYIAIWCVYFKGTLTFLFDSYISIWRVYFKEKHIFLFDKYISIQCIFVNFWVFIEALSGSAQKEWGHSARPPVLLDDLPPAWPRAGYGLSTHLLSNPQCHYTQYECGSMQPLLWSDSDQQVSCSRNLRTFKQINNNHDIYTLQ
jgi:hypothetical protein